MYLYICIYCENRPNYSFLEKAGQFKNLDSTKMCVQLFELTSSAKPGGSKSSLCHWGFPNSPVSHSCAKPGGSENFVKLDGLESADVARDFSNCSASRSFFKK